MKAMTHCLAILLGILLACEPLAAENVVTIVGNGQKGYSGDGGPAAAAQVNNPYAVARGPDGLIYICDVDNQRIRRIEKDGTITTYAGNGQKGYAGDGGPAKDAALTEPYEMAWDKSGNLYFVERMNHIVRRVDARTHTISTLAGTGKAGFGGDGGRGRWRSSINRTAWLLTQMVNCWFVISSIIASAKLTLTPGVITTCLVPVKRKRPATGAPISGSPLHGPRAMALAGDGKNLLALREGNAVLKMDPKANLLKLVAGTGKSGFTATADLRSRLPSLSRSAWAWMPKVTSTWPTQNRIPFA